MPPQKRADKWNKIVNVCLVAFIGFLAWRLYHRSQLPKLLMQSVEAQDVSAVRQLLAEGADPSTHDHYNSSALYRAMYPFSRTTNASRDAKRTEQIMYLLLDAGAKPDCLTSALGFETDGPALKMIEKGAIVSPDMFVRAAQRNNARLMQRIWERTHTDINKRFDSMTPLGWLANAGSGRDEKKQVEAAKWLLAHGANPNLGRLDTSLLKRPEIAFNNDITPLMDAASRNQPALVRLLLQHGAKTEAHNGFGHTALLCAIFQNSTPCVRELITGGVNVNVKDAEGRTALQTAQVYARKTGNNETVDLLRQAGAMD